MRPDDRTDRGGAGRDTAAAEDGLDEDGAPAAENGGPDESGPKEGRVSVAVVVPTYNEVENLPVLVERLLALDPAVDVICVDDASPDGTGEAGDEIALSESRFRIVHRTGRRGYAPASLEGLKLAYDQGYEFVCTMDADLSHEPGALPALVARAQQGADLVVGSRYVPGGAVVAEWSAFRRAVSKSGSAYARAMLGAPVHDCTSGFRCYSRRALALITSDTLRSEGYCFLIEVLHLVLREGLETAEVPIRYVDRTAGRSKISRAIIAEALWRTTVFGVERALGADRPRRTLGVGPSRQKDGLGPS